MGTREPMQKQNHRKTGFSLKNVPHAVVGLISRYVFSDIVYTVRRGLLKGMKRKGGLAFIPFGGISKEDQFFQTIADDGVFKDAVVCDVGSHIGLMTLLFIRHGARRVDCFEPSAYGLKGLRENLRVNSVGSPVVTIHETAVGDRTGVGVLATHEEHSRGMATLMPRNDVVGEPITSEEVRVTTIDVEIASGRIPAPDFLKIDIEGYELAALNGAQDLLKRTKPRIFIELHGHSPEEKDANVRNVVAFLAPLGYVIRHVETGSEITVSNCSVAREGHIYCT